MASSRKDFQREDGGVLGVTMGQEDFAKTGRRHCALACVCLVVVLGTSLGFLAGLLVGSLLATHTRLASEGQESLFTMIAMM